MAHANARLTPAGRMILCRRIAAGRPVAQVAAEMGISRTCADRWWARYHEHGQVGLVDRPSRAHRHPRRTPLQLETQVLELRQSGKLGPARIAPLVGLPASTVYRVLCRHRLNRLAWMDRPTGQLIRRYERAHPGELVHMDVKQLGRIPPGGGHRVHGRDSAQHRGRDRDRWREVAAPATTTSTPPSTTIRGWPMPRSGRRTGSDLRGVPAPGWGLLRRHNIAIQRVLTDNAMAYRRSVQVRAAVAELGAVQRFTRPYRPQTNGKAERFNRTLLVEWAYLRPDASNQERTAALDGWLQPYNHHRAHTALGGQPPISRVNNAPDSYS